MKKIIGGIGLLIFISIIAGSCSKSETYADKLKAQKKAVNRLMSDSGFYTTNTYPEGRAFYDKEFFVDPSTGVYFHVVDSGNGNRASSKTRTQVSARIKWTWRPLYTDTVVYQNVGVGYEHERIDFNYGQSSTYVNYSTANGYYNYYFKSAGLVAPLSYVGEGAIIKLLVPFNDVGSGYQQQYYEPVFFGYLRYDFEPEQEQ